MNNNTAQLISDMVLRSAMALDRDNLEGWVEHFAEQTRYVVLPRENRDQGYTLGLMYCDNKSILKDRVSVLRHASKFNPHYDRHIVNNALVVSESDGLIKAETNFMVVQTTLQGVSELYCAGCYEDTVEIVGGVALIRERIVLLDTFSVSNCMAVPL